MKLNSAENFEPIRIRVTKEAYPIVFENKVEELVEDGLTREEAEAEVEGMEFECELYYHKTYGLFAVESGAVEAGTIYSPYDGELCEDADIDC